MNHFRLCDFPLRGNYAPLNTMKFERYMYATLVNSVAWYEKGQQTKKLRQRSKLNLQKQE